MHMGVVAWMVLGVIAASLERSILRRPGGTFLGSLMLAWAGATLGGLVASILGWSEVTDLSLQSLAIATGGIVLILGGLRLAQQLRGRTGEHTHAPDESSRCSDMNLNRDKGHS